MLKIVSIPVTIKLLFLKVLSSVVIISINKPKYNARPLQLSSMNQFTTDINEINKNTTFYQLFIVKNTFKGIISER